MDDEDQFGQARDAFVNILSSDILTGDSTTEILGKAFGILNVSHKAFLRQKNDSSDFLRCKRFWLRWLIRRLIALCIELKDWSQVKQKCIKILALIMKKAITDHSLLYTLTENYILFLSDLEKVSKSLFGANHNEILSSKEPIRLQKYGTKWTEPQNFIELEGNNDPYIEYQKYIDVTLSFGHECEILQEVICDVLSLSPCYEAMPVSSNIDEPITHFDRMVAKNTGLNLAVTPKSLNELWRILIRQLNIHENNVKRSSLDLITKLLVAGRIPSQNDLGKLVELLFLLLRFFLQKTASNNTKKRKWTASDDDNVGNSPSTFRDEIELMKSWALCLDKLISCLKTEKIVNLESQREIHLLLRDSAAISKIPNLCPMLQKSVWKCLSYILETGKSIETQDIGLKEITQNWFSSPLIDEKWEEKDSSNDFSQTKVECVSSMIIFEILQSDIWKTQNSNDEKIFATPNQSDITSSSHQIINTGGSFIEVKQTSSCWTMFCDRIQQISNDIPSRLVEYVDEATFLLSVAKCVITLLPKENTGSVELVFFERHVLSQFVHSLMEARQACCQKITKKYHNYHSFFSNAIRDLVMMQPTDTFTQALLHEIIGYLTIPWMADQTKFSDLRLPQEVFKKLAEISVQIRHRIPDDEAFTTTFLDESLISLIFGGFVKNVALKWRLIVAEKIWSIARILLKSGHQKWIEHIINSLPLLLHSHGNGSLPLVKEILEDILNSQNERLIIILSKVSGILICTLTKKTRLQNEMKGLKYVDNLVCSHCDRKQHKLISSQQPPFTLTSEQDMSIVSLLTKLIGYGDTDARLAILNMIIPMSNHIGFWESPLESSVNLWLSCYLEGDDGESALHFVRHLNYLAAPAWIIEKIEIVNSGTNKMSKFCNDDSFKHSSTIEEMMSVENGPTKFNERHRVWTEICKSLQLLCNKAINSTTYDVQHVQLVESAVFGVVNIGLLNISSLEKDILNLLLDLYFSSSCHISTFCQADIMIKKMLVSHKTHACNRLAAQMCSTVNHNSLSKHQFVVKGANPTLRIFVTLYEGDNETTNKSKKGQKEKAFLTEQLDHLLPSIVLESCRAGPCQKEHETSALQYVAEELKINKKQLVGENLCYIFPHIVLHFKDKDELRKCMLFIGKETGTQFWDLVPSQRTSIIHELVTKLSKGKDRILIGLELIAKNDADGMKTYGASNGNMDNIKGVKGSRETVDLPKFMLPYLMGCLDYIDNRLSVHSTTMEDDIDFGIEMMRSLQHLIKIMGGNNIGCVKYKLLSTIKTASSWVSRHKKGNIVITETWETMIKTIDLEELCPIVGTILANLTVMYQNNDVSDTKKLLNLFRHLIVQNKAVFLENFTRLHFLPEYPEFIEFNQIIREANEITDNTEFKYVLAAIVDSTMNESIEAKFLALTKLLHVLKSNQGKVQGLILSSDQVNVSITRLINLLMSLIAISSEDDTSIACIAGKCIGSLGAVDPGRLEIICDLNCDNIVGLNVYDDNFCYLLLSILTNAYLAALSSGSAEDAKKCSYSIQQSLRFYKIKQYVNNSKQCIMQNTSSLEAIVWSKLKDSSKEVLGQFFDSLYERVYSKPSYTLPIFKSTFGSTYKHWLSNWSTQLISKVMDKNVADVFKGCIPSVHCDIKVAQHLLPYILVTVISQSKDHAREVREEIEVILDENTTNQQMTQKDMNNFLFNEENEDGDWNRDNKGESYELKYNAVRMVFAILDHMNKWSKKRYSQLTQKMKPRDDPSDYTSKDLQFVSIKEFVDSIKPKTLAKVALESKSYARSLLYLEIHLRKDPGDLNACYFNLQTIYGALKESDYLAGLKKVKKGDLSMSEMIHHNQAMGNFQDAVACCESIGRYTKEQSSVTKMGLGLKLCILQCYLELDRPQTAFELAKGYVRSNPEWAKRMKPLQLKAAQQLGQWADVKELLPEDESCLNSGSWEANLSGLLLKLHEQTFSGKSYAKLLNNSRQIEVSALSLSVKEQGAYTRCYENIVRLQILDEIESIASCMKVINQGSDGKNIESAVVACENLFEEWKTRMNFSGSSLSSLEHVLQVRRNLLSILVNLIDAKHSNSNSKQGGQITKTILSSLKLQVQAEVGENLLFSAKFARKENRLEKAFSILLEAEKFKHPELFIERSKLVWARQDCREAISILEKGIETHFPEYTFGFSRDKIVSIDDSKREICAKAKLLLARYVDEAASYAPGTIIKYYEEARAMSKKSEEANYASATFFDKIIGKNYEAKDLDTRGSVVRHIIQLYGNSLTHGCDHLDQSLPRMLSLWFDFGSRYEENLKYGAKGDHPKASERLKVIEDMGKHLKRINELMSLFVNKYKNTPYLLLAALPQLISRICHSHGDIYKVLRTMLITAFSNYPQQVIWHVIPLLKSSYAVRSSRGQEVIDQIKAKCPHLNKIIDDGLLLSDKLLKLCDEKSTASGNDRVGVVNLNQLMPSLLKLINNSNFSKIIMPSNYNMTMRLPTKQVGMLNHDAFSSTSLVYFEKVEENVTIMRSLVKPKKLDFLGSDGKKYSFLCKPKDDLRRDCRLLEFNNLLNKLFMKDPECRKRNLHIRTYTVIPLNETNGIIEWVNNVVPFRTIITKLYKEKLGKNYMRPQEINDYTCNPGEVQKNKKNYDYLLKRHTPAVFGEWFVNNFPDPQAWFMARMSYTRTTAVMSMVCYLIGLGDRHCENIMYDETNGDTLHVDLNCLFNKGAELRVPEIIPFRLTPNMVSAFGPTGYEGPFRLACEAALGLMRKQKDVLMSSLRPFVYDPLVDWVPKGEGDSGKRMKAGDKSKETGEIVNETAVVTLKNIDNRLKGLIDDKKHATDNLSSGHIPLSVAGQVDHLIKEATSYENLSQMYHGWAPYL